jgi:hypothetical protein
MLRKVASKVAWVGRTASMVFGLALIMALLFGVASMAFARDGEPFLLGVRNVASNVSTLVRQDPGPALSLQVDSGAPLKVNSESKVTNLNADKLDNYSLNSFYELFMSRDTYRNESDAPVAGTQLGDGTYNLSESCETGDVLLSGGPANIDAETDLLESFPSGNNSWTVRVNKNGQTDDFSVVVLCAWQ